MPSWIGWLRSSKTRFEVTRQTLPDGVRGRRAGRGLLATTSRGPHLALADVRSGLVVSSGLLRRRRQRQGCVEAPERRPSVRGVRSCGATAPSSAPARTPPTPDRERAAPPPACAAVQTPPPSRRSPPTAPLSRRV